MFSMGDYGIPYGYTPLLIALLSTLQCAIYTLFRHTGFGSCLLQGAGAACKPGLKREVVTVGQT